jgi:hypothetical protein
MKLFHIVSGVVDTGEQLITRVNIKLRITPPQIFEKIRNGTNGILRGQGKNSKISCQTPFKSQNFIQTAMTLNILGMFVQCLVMQYI